MEGVEFWVEGVGFRGFVGPSVGSRLHGSSGILIKSVSGGGRVQS